jgi:hypothetical protein
VSAMRTLWSTEGEGKGSSAGGEREGEGSRWGGEGRDSGEGAEGEEFGSDSMKEYSAVSLKEGRRWEPLEASVVLAERGSEELRVEERGLATFAATGTISCSSSPSCSKSVGGESGALSERGEERGGLISGGSSGGGEEEDGGGGTEASGAGERLTQQPGSWSRSSPAREERRVTWSNCERGRGPSEGVEGGASG